MSNYQDEILKSLPSILPRIKKGEVNILDVLHDDWCPFLNGNGDCTCNPELVLQIPKKAVKK